MNNMKTELVAEWMKLRAADLPPNEGAAVDSVKKAMRAHILRPNREYKIVFTDAHGRDHPGTLRSTIINELFNTPRLYHSHWWNFFRNNDGLDFENFVLKSIISGRYVYNMMDAMRAGVRSWTFSASDETVYLHYSRQGSKLDENGLLHCLDGPACMRCGQPAYFWHGVDVPKHWTVRMPSARTVISTRNVERRLVGARVIGWPALVKQLGAKVIDEGPSPDVGKLVSMRLPGVGEGLFLVAECPRNGTIVEGVPLRADNGLMIRTALDAQAWRVGLNSNEYVHPPRRT